MSWRSVHVDVLYRVRSRIEWIGRDERDFHCRQHTVSSTTDMGNIDSSRARACRKAVVNTSDSGNGGFNVKQTWPTGMIYPQAPLTISLGGTAVVRRSMK